MQFVLLVETVVIHDIVSCVDFKTLCISCSAGSSLKSFNSPAFNL